MLSIIVPALNEEKNLPLLLESIRKQGFRDDYEVIVADAGSRDKTIEVARSYGCKVVPGGLPGKGRNEGAKVAEGDLLLFVDGDLVLSRDFFRENIQEFKARELDIAGFPLCPYQKSALFKLFFDVFYNWPAQAVEQFLPHASGTILVKKTVHRKIGGFDEQIRIAEDHAYARQGAKIGRFGILGASPVLVTTQRFDRDGWATTYLKYILCELHTIFLGPVKSDIFRYRFGHYDEKKPGKTRSAFDKLSIPFRILWQTIAIILVIITGILVSFFCFLGMATKILWGKIAKT